MHIIGESINSTIREVGEAIGNRDEHFIVELAQKQVSAGAGRLDVNVAVADGDEAENMLWAERSVQSAINIPLALDSRDLVVLKAALEAHQGRAMINSISGERGRANALFALAAEYNCDVILLCLGERGIPKTAEERCALAASLVEQAGRVGIGQERLYVDPLVMAIGSNWNAARVTLETLRLIRKELPQAHTIAGFSNVSFGMPQRSLLNRTLLAMAIAHGLDSFLINVLDRALMATLRTANTLMGNDPYCSEYLEAHRAGKLDV
jgi:5-methyltetrahydrofolate corrinoid/iron sulfur protein methyltransferase